MEDSSEQHASGSVPVGSKNRDRCAYCGVNRSFDPSRKYFKFPKDPNRCQIWVSRCNKPFLSSKTPQQLHMSYKLCSNHFLPDDFVQPSKHRLKSTANPVFPGLVLQTENSNVDVNLMKMKLAHKMDSMGDSEVILMDSNISLSMTNPMPSSSREDEMPLSFTHPVPSEISIIHPVPRLSTNVAKHSFTCSTPKSLVKKRIFTPKTRKIRNLKSQIFYLKQKQTRGFTRPSDILRHIKSSVPDDIYTFICSQLSAANVSKYGRRWNAKDKNLALKIYLASPKAYNILYQHFYFPTKKTILKSISGLNIEPGFCVPVFRAFERIVEKLKAPEKCCVISFDEIKLKKGLQFYKKLDMLIGYENYGNHTIENPQLATHALLFMVRGICKKWKQVIGVFFSANTTKSNILKSLIYEAIEKLKDCGLIPVCLVCDQGANNVKLYRTELGTTEKKPYFLANDSKIYTIFDPPHLLKSLRNNFKNYKVKFFDNNQKVYKHAEWSHITELYNFDQKADHRAVPKLTARHINVDGLSKMNVGLAAQIFSRSVAGALYYFSMIPDMPSSAAHTALFCEKVNGIFDSVNSRILFHKTNPLLSACSIKSPHVKHWEESIKFLETVEFDTGDKGLKFNCLTGWIQTLSAFKMLTNDLLNIHKIPFVLMSRFNQDALENFFSQVRRKGGFNDHPTPIDFMYRMRLLIAQNIITTCENTNCQRDDDDVLIPIEVLSSFMTEQDEPIADNNNDTDINENLINKYLSSCNSDDLKSYKLGTSAFFAGYIAKKVLENSDCSTCRADLIDDSKTLSATNMLINFKEFDNLIEGLAYPQEPLSSAIMYFGEVFTNSFQNISHCIGLSKLFLSELSNFDFDFLTCPIHRMCLKDNILNLYVKIMIFYKVKFISQTVNDTKRREKKIKKLL